MKGGSVFGRVFVKGRPHLTDPRVAGCCHCRPEQSSVFLQHAHSAHQHHHHCLWHVIITTILLLTISIMDGNVKKVPRAGEKGEWQHRLECRLYLKGWVGRSCSSIPSSSSSLLACYCHDQPFSSSHHIFTSAKTENSECYKSTPKKSKVFEQCPKR